MADTAPVVQELIVTSDNAGAIAFAQAMANAQLASQQALGANDNYARSMRAANDNAREAAEGHSRMTLGLRQVSQAALETAEAYAKKAAVAAVVTTALGVMLGVILPLYTAYKILSEAVHLVTDAWTLGNARLAEYVALSEKAAASNVTVDFYQRITKAAGDAKLSVDDLVAAVKRMEDQSAGKVGGSAGGNRMKELTEWGNFAGNTGVAAFGAANSPEERFRALASLIDQAIRSGERFAAIDVARTFFGDKVADNLAKNAGYLNKMVADADKIKAEDLVSGAAVANAVELQNRLDAAEKILSQRWHPVQDLLVQAGINMKEAWVGIVEQIAAAVDGATRFIAKLGEAPAWFQDKLNKGASWFTDATTTPASRAQAEKDYGITSDPLEMAGLEAERRFDLARNNGMLDAARKKLAEAMYRSTEKSKAKPTESDGPDSSAFDRAEESLRKYIETTNAAATSIDMTAAAQERLKAIAQLTAAGMKDGLSREAATAKAEMSGLADQAGRAADALARARVTSSINFGRNTALLSQEDVNIASQLRSIYPNVTDALNSAEAAQMRFNSAARSLSQSIENELVSGLTDIVSGAKTAEQGFSDMAKAIVRAIEQMVIKMMIVEPLMRGLQTAFNSFGLGGGGAGVSTVAAGHHAGGIVGAEASFHRAVSNDNFTHAPRFHSGLMPDEFPAILQRGEGVFTRGQMAALGGVSRVPNITIHNHTDAKAQTTTDSNGDVTITFRKMVDGMVADSVANGDGGRVIENKYGLKQYAGR